MAVRQPLAVIDGLIRQIDPADTVAVYNSVMAVFGDGSDGNVTISTTVTLTRDMYYNNLTVTGTGHLVVAGYRVFVRGTLTVDSGGVVAAHGGTTATPFFTTFGRGDSTLASPALSVPQGGAVGGSGTVRGATAAGGNGGSHLGATGGTGGSVTNAVGGKGGAGGAGFGTGSGAGGSAGTVTAPTYQPGYALAELLLATFQSLGSGPPGTPTALSGGSSGGGGGYGGSYTGGQNATFGGGGGAGGGVLVLAAYAIVNNGSINSNGSDGGNGGGNAVDNKYGGGGGGGGGGDCVVLYRTHTGNAPTSSGGTGGAAGGTGAVAGSNGSSGKLIFLAM